VHTGFWWGSLRDRHHVEELVVDGMVILKWILKKLNGSAFVGLIWLRIGKSGGIL
jgi:hypothetical protein